MDKGVNKIINNYILYLKKSNLEFDKVYLFGSYAKNKQSTHSDIDFLSFSITKNRLIILICKFKC
jgi:predicted nucleotidyltransferase